MEIGKGIGKGKGKETIIDILIMKIK